MEPCTTEPITILRYVLFVLQDGDYLNDWLTHMCSVDAALWQFIGYLLYVLGMTG